MPGSTVNVLAFADDGPEISGLKSMWKFCTGGRSSLNTALYVAS